MQKFLQIHYILLAHPSFYRIYRNQKAQAVSSTVKDICVFYFFDNFGQWEGELIQHNSTAGLLDMPLAIYSGISIVLLANRLLPLAINFEYSKIVFVSRSLYRRNCCIVAPFQLCQNFSAIQIFLMLPNCISVNIYYYLFQMKDTEGRDISTDCTTKRQQ